MPLYEYRCRQCDVVFEARRQMSEADGPATCPAGHDDAVRLLSVFAAPGRTAATATPGMGRPCGNACVCYPH